MLLCCSKGIWRQRSLLVHYFDKPLTMSASNYVEAVVGWGLKSTSQHARDYAKQHGLPYLALEDGFIGYIGHPAANHYRLSLIIDRTGIYYDASRPSDLETILDDMSWWNADWQRRSEQLQQLMLQHGLTKYNYYAVDQLPASTLSKLDKSRRRILLVDQTAGDQSIRLGLASSASFSQMLAAARLENPEAQLIVRTHPDVVLGKKKSCFTNSDLHGVLLLDEPVNPQALLAQMDHVYVVTSQLGFEALLAGKPVTTFGVPFYAGWGLTDDRIEVPRRGKARTVQQLLAAACLRYTRYVDPITLQPCQLEDLIDLVLAQRGRPPYYDCVYAVGFSFWKRSFIGQFAGRHARRVKFGRRDWVPSSCDAVLKWGASPKANHLVASADALPMLHMEDGFLRSVGLGSDLRRPASLVLDSRGMYYDPSCPSDLEHFLAHHEFTTHELAQGEDIQQALQQKSLSKYNVGAFTVPNWRALAGEREIILVPGQVEDDASVLLGSQLVRNNTELLQRVRAANPNAYIVYKTHPDVRAGNRVGQVLAADLTANADAVADDMDIVSCLLACDTVHTMTSLAGLEALIHQRKVVVWGQPFYAGWQLTTDMSPVPRRGRALSLPALVYAAYSWYPIYIDWRTGLYSTPLRLMSALTQEKLKTPQASVSGWRGWLLRRWRKLMYVWEAMVR